jgi:hypothetical protein
MSQRSPDGQASPTHPLEAQGLSLLVGVLLEGANPAPLRAVLLPALANAAQALEAATPVLVGLPRAAGPGTALVGLPRAAGQGTVLVGLPRAAGPGPVLNRALLATGTVLSPTLNLWRRCAGSNLMRPPLSTCASLMAARMPLTGKRTQTWTGRSGAPHGASFWAAVVAGFAHAGETCPMSSRLAPISHGASNTDTRISRRM